MNLATTRRNTTRPANIGARLKRRVDLESLTREGVTKDIRQIIPDLAAVQSIGKVGLRATVIETVLATGDLQGDTTRDRVVAQNLGVLLAWGNLLAGSNGTTHGPEVDGGSAVVLHDGVADSAGHGDQGGYGGDEGSGEVHCDELVSDDTMKGCMKMRGDLVRMMLNENPSCGN